MKPKSLYSPASGMIVLLAVSLVGNVICMVRQLPWSFGGGRHEASPNKKFVARAKSLRDVSWFAPDSRVYGELSVRPSGDDSEAILAITIRPERVADEMTFRDLDELIQWSEDSSSVTFKTPTGVFQVRMPDSD